MRKTLALTKVAALAAALPLFAAAAPAVANDANAFSVANLTPASAPITVAEVEAAQRAWGDALVAISTAGDTQGPAAARRLAEQALDTAYGYNLGPVAFKPTLTQSPQTFRDTRAGALAYFVGGDSNFPNDTGFALKHWRSYSVNNATIVINGPTAVAMGNFTFTDRNGDTTTVDKTFGYVRDPQGALRIVLHHSSLPYSAD
ncbi:MAG: phosphoribosyl-AMP cyclohydrolase [Brevundimonas sp.]